MKRLLLIPVFLLVLAAAAFADYKMNISNGDVAKEMGDEEQALKYYRAAFAENPNAKLAELIKKLEEESGYTPGHPAISKPVENVNSPWGVVLVFGDLVMAGASVFTYFEYQTALRKVDENFFAIWEAEMHAFIMGATISVAAGMVAYTLADLFFLHAVFPKNTEAAFNPVNNEFKLTYNYEF